MENRDNAIYQNMIHVIITNSPAFEPLAEVIKPSWENWASAHGYKMVWNKAEQKDFCFTFNKFDFVERYMKETNDDYYFIAGCDMLITNPGDGLEDFLEIEPILITADCNGLNSEGIILRHCRITAEWLKRLWEMRYTHKNDQDAINALHCEYVDHTKFIPHPSFNSIPYHLYDGFGWKKKSREVGQWEPGDLLMHLPGMTLQMRMDIFNNCIAQNYGL